MTIEAFISYLNARDRSARTINAYRDELALFLRWYEETVGEPLQPEKVTPLDVKMWRDAMEADGLSPATINRRLSALRAYFRWAKGTRQVRIDPTAEIRSKRQQATGPKWLDRKQVNRLRNAAQVRLQVAEARKNERTAREAKRDKAILALFLGAGLRLSELVALRMSDIVIRERSGSLTIRSGKRRKWRTVPLNRDVRAALRDWLPARGSSGGEALFVGRGGTPLQPRGVERIISRLAEDAKLDPREVSPHTLRHTFGKALIDAGEPLEKVQMLLGHESITTTIRYTTPSAQDLEAAVERLTWNDEG